MQPRRSRGALDEYMNSWIPTIKTNRLLFAVTSKQDFKGAAQWGGTETDGASAAESVLGLLSQVYT